MNSPAKKWDHLLHKKIELVFGDDVINSYEFLEITPTEEFVDGVDGVGRVYLVKVKWHQQIPNFIPTETMSYPEDVFQELTDTGIATYRPTPAMKYRIADQVAHES